VARNPTYGTSEAAMDAAPLTPASTTPLRMQSIALHVRDLPRCVDFYQHAAGLQLIDRTVREAVLGNDGAALIVLRARPDLDPDDPKRAGLHHLAFIMPTRRDLADWYRHTRDIGLPLTRTGDHHVNEALYFDDPEGNGCEFYSDRPPEHWRWEANGELYIPAIPVDMESLQRDESPDHTDWRLPRAVRLGHINLRVGALDPAQHFYCSVLGLDHTCRRPIMTFMSSGRYHHHMAANTISSAGAGRRDAARSGLAAFAFAHDARFDADATRVRLRRADMPVREIAGGFETDDPWGNTVQVVAL
jgi:catechol 2,3-dioxygenase